MSMAPWTFDATAFDRPTMLGIDIREGSIRLVQATGTAVLSKINHIAEWPLPPGMVKDGVVVRPRQMAAVLREHMMHDLLQTARCVFSIPSRFAVVADLALPPMPPEELNEAARFRLKKSSPFSLEDAYVETMAFPDIDEDGNRSTLAIASPKAVVDSRADTLAFAGLEPIAAETDAQSILRVIHRRAARLDSLERDSSLTVIDVGEEATAMYVVRQRRLRFMRTVKFGIVDLHRRILSVVPEGDPVEILSAPSTAVLRNGHLEFQWAGQTKTIPIHDEMARLTKEVSRLLRYFQSMHPERSYRGLLDTMLMCGDLAATPGFLEYFASEFSFKADLLKPLFEVNMGVHTRIRDVAEANETKFVTATGCLLLGMEEGDTTRRDHHGSQTAA